MAKAAAAEKVQQDHEKRLIAQIEKKHGKSVEELRQEREKRIRDAMEMKVPDRVPVTFNAGAFAAKYAGLPASAMFYDPVAYSQACLKVLLDFETDSGGGMGGTNSGLMLELLAPKHQRWPGGSLPPDGSYQYVEGEYMKAEEYDLFLSDPSDFVQRYLLPRTYEIMEPMAEIPAFRNMISDKSFPGLLGYFLRPEFVQAAKKLTQAAEEQRKWNQATTAFSAQMRRLGFPSEEQQGSTPGGAPFDAVSDFLRGMRGTMLDMYRCPDKLLAACDRILQWRIERSTPARPKVKGEMVRGGGAPLHRGSDGFMSIPQFEKFYWPGLKKAIMTAVELGYTTSSFCEGIWNERLEYWLEIPRGKAILRFEKTDMVRAKKVLGNHHCIQGGVPPILLEVASPSEVEEYCKKLIKVCGKDGGFILSPGSSIDGAKPANLKAMVDSASKYGRY